MYFVVVVVFSLLLKISSYPGVIPVSDLGSNVSICLVLKGNASLGHILNGEWELF